MSHLFNKPEKTTPLSGTEYVLIQLPNGKIYKIKSSLFLGQFLSLSSLGNRCFTYPIQTAIDCQTGEEITLPLQIDDVMDVWEEAICKAIQDIADIKANCCNGSSQLSNLIYDELLGEPNEWKVQENTSGQNINLDEEKNPYSQNLHIRVSETNPNLENEIVFTKSSLVSKENISGFDFWAYKKEGSANIMFKIVFFNDATQASVPIYVYSGQYGFSNTTVGYQNVIVALTEAMFTQNYFNKIVLTVVNIEEGNTIDHVDLDYFKLNFEDVNVPPTVNTIANQTIQLPTSSVSVTAYASDPDGSITSYLWEKISGGTATIVSPNSATTNITGLSTAGTYVFRVTVTDNQGATAQDVIVITVLTAGALVPPTADAGSDVNIALPTTEASLDGSGSSDDSAIVSYEWNQISGASATIVSPNSAITEVTGLSTAGNYVFQLTVTDNDALTDTDTVTVVVATEQPVPVAIEIDQGSCGSPADFTSGNETVYIKKLQSEIDTGFISIEDGDILYSDALATTPFDGGANLWMYRGIPPNQVNNQTFKVSVAGVVSSFYQCLLAIDQSLDIDVDSSSSSQSDHYVRITLAMLLNGYTGSSPAKFIRILTNTDRGELALHSVDPVIAVQDLTLNNINVDEFEFWAYDLDGNGLAGSYTTSFDYTIIDEDGNETNYPSTFTINVTDNA